MTDAAGKTLILIPPPGPLAWLHPELQRGETPVELSSGSSSDRDGPEVLDCSRQGLCGAALVGEVLDRAPDRICVPDGPRGHALWAWLSQAVRDTPIKIGQPSWLPQHPPEVGEGLFPRYLPLESLLAEAARRAPPATTVVIENPDEARPVFHFHPLDPEEARSMAERSVNEARSLWLCPFRHGDDVYAQLEAARRAVSANPSAFREGGLLPYFVTELPACTGDDSSSSPVETRLLPSWWGLLPGNAWPDPVREAYHEVFRLLHPERTFLFRLFENHALAAVDLYTESLMGRFAGDPVDRKIPSGQGGPVILGVCGTDGSGKSSHVEALRCFLQEKGLKVQVRKMYRHGVFHDTVTDLTRQCAAGRNLHLWRIQRLVKVFDSVKFYYTTVEADLEAFDVIIFDRYVYTHFAAGAGRYHHDPFARELLSVYPPADRIYLLDVPTDEALRRIGTRSNRTVDENPYMLARYRHALLDLGDRNDFVVLDGLKPFEKNRTELLNDAESLLKARGLLR